MENVHKHVICVVRNNQNEFLQYFDERWNCYLFPNVKDEVLDDKILNKNFSFIGESVSCSFLGKRVHVKFSESAKCEKKYQHLFYLIEFKEVRKEFLCKNFFYKNNKYCWLSLDELKSDSHILKVNSDIISYVDDFLKER